MRPDVIGSTPETQFTSVVLPEPFGPIRPRISPESRLRSIPARAVTPPNRLTTFLSERRTTLLTLGSVSGCGERPACMGPLAMGDELRSRPPPDGTRQFRKREKALLRRVGRDPCEVA